MEPTPSKRWVRFARFFLCGIGAFFLGFPFYSCLVREVPFSIGMVVVGGGGLILIGLGLFTKAKTAVEIAESI